jgi:hypothetical protein
MVISTSSRRSSCEESRRARVRGSVGDRDSHAHCLFRVHAYTFSNTLDISVYGCIQQNWKYEALPRSLFRRKVIFAQGACHVARADQIHAQCCSKSGERVRLTEVDVAHSWAPKPPKFGASPRSKQLPGSFSTEPQPHHRARVCTLMRICKSDRMVPRSVSFPTRIDWIANTAFMFDDNNCADDYRIGQADSPIDS